MFHNGRKTIGVFVFRPGDSFQQKICKGITDEAQRHGYNVAFFASFGKYSGNARFVKGERQIIHLPPYEELDGIIVVTDTLDIDGAKDELISMIKERCHCPVIFIRDQIDGFHSINVEDESGIEEMLLHFIEVHEFERICFMAGRLDLPEGKARLESFQCVMAEYDLPVTEQQIFYGDFWKTNAQEACDHFFKNGYQPQVIVCANDFMAISLASELIRRGYRIPEDVCISGFDGIPDTRLFSPSITTVDVPLYDMGEEAVKMISGHENDINHNPEHIVFPTKVVLNESCGCYTLQKQELLLSRSEYYQRTENSHAQRLTETFMSINLQEVDSIKSLSELMSYNIYSLEGYESYFLCLCDGLENQKGEAEFLTEYTDTMHLRVGFHERQYMGEVDQQFFKSELLPSSVCGELPQIYYFLPLHYNEHCFGYQALSFLESENAGTINLPWMVNIENAIENIIVQSERESMISELEYMYIRDSLTDLFNRRGFDKFGIPLCERAIQDKSPLFVMGIDLDGMKEINDTYGHQEGDHALCIVAEAIRYASTKNDVGARMGGDEFSIVGYGKTEEDVEEFKERFNRFLDEYNQSKKSPYQVYASFGVYYEVPRHGSTLESCLQNSDRRMYRNKADNKGKRGLTVR